MDDGRGRFLVSPAFQRLGRRRFGVAHVGRRHAAPHERHLPVVPGRPDDHRARDGLDVRALRQLLQALPAGVVGADRDRVEPRQPHLRVPHGWRAHRVPRGMPVAGRRREPVPRFRCHDRERDVGDPQQGRTTGDVPRQRLRSQGCPPCPDLVARSGRDVPRIDGRTRGVGGLRVRAPVEHGRTGTDHLRQHVRDRLGAGPVLRARVSAMADLNVIPYRPERSNYAWTFGGADPVMRVKPGDVLELWTDDCFTGLVSTVDDLASEKITFPFLNTQTGPFFVEGAEPGDTLALHFVSIEPARDWGVSTTFPLFGALTSTLATVTLQDPLEELVWIYEVDAVRRTVRYEARRSDHTVELPLEPMHGTVGVAPANLEARSALVPGAHGGNMDTPEMRAGTTCYLGVNVPGALFSIGDGHYRQGEGETCGVAVEGAMETTLIVDLIKGRQTPWPRLEDETYIMSTGSGSPTETWSSGSSRSPAWTSLTLTSW